MWVKYCNFLNYKHLYLCVLCVLCGFEKFGLILHSEFYILNSGTLFHHFYLRQAQCQQVIDQYYVAVM